MIHPSETLSSTGAETEPRRRRSHRNWNHLDRWNRKRLFDQKRGRHIWIYMDLYSYGHL